MLFFLQALSRNQLRCWFPGCPTKKLSYDALIHIQPSPLVQIPVSSSLLPPDVASAAPSHLAAETPVAVATNANATSRENPLPVSLDPEVQISKSETHKVQTVLLFNQISKVKIFQVNFCPKLNLRTFETCGCVPPERKILCNLN